MNYLSNMTTEDLLAVLSYRRATYARRQADAERTKLRSDRALADEAYTSLHLAQRALQERGIDV